jgi:hypothetical protein
MANLDSVADKAVHDAVDAFMEGRLVPDFMGETVFETKHSRYRLRDGVVYAAPSDGLIGAELVGWLMETPRRSVVESAWQPGSRAVLVDRARGRNIIVTSSTRLLHLEAPNHEPVQPERSPPHGYSREQPRQQGYVPQGYAAPLGAPAGRHAPVFPSTPLPPSYTSPLEPPRTPPPPAPAAWPVSLPLTAIPRAPIPRRIEPERRAVHLPPRPIGGTPAGGRQPTTPFPAIHAQPPPVVTHSDAAPVSEIPWELTSSEIELDSDDGDDGDDAMVFSDGREIPAATESGAGAPIPLVKPRDVPR